MVFKNPFEQHLSFHGSSLRIVHVLFINSSFVLVILIPFMMNMVMVRLRGSQLLHRRRDLSHFSATQLQLALPAGDNQHQHFHDHFHQDCDDDFNGNFVMIFITIRTINTFKILTLNIKNDIRDVCSTDGSLTFC